jgi:hypothetical protein
MKSVITSNVCQSSVDKTRIVSKTYSKFSELSRYSDWLRAGRPGGDGILSPGRVKNFHFSISSRPAVGPTQPPKKMCTGGSFPGVKRQGREGDQSPPTSAEVKKM